MELKGHYTTTIVVAYFILLFLFFVYQKKVYENYRNDLSPDHNCTKFLNHYCVNFCPLSSEKFSDETLIGSYMNISEYNEHFFEDYEAKSEKIMVIREEITCEGFDRKVIVEDLKGIVLTWVKVFKIT